MVSGETATLPHDFEAERSILGSIIIDNQHIVSVIDKIQPDDFYDIRHKLVYGAMIGLFKETKEIDFLTLIDKCKANGSIATIGGDYIVTLGDDIFNASNVERYAEIILEKSIRRRLIRVGQETALTASDESAELNEVIERAEGHLLKLSEARVGDFAENMGDLLSRAFKRLEERQNGSHSKVIPSNFKNLDNMIEGLNPSDLIILAARPSMGKTAFALNMAYNVATQGKGVLLFSIEMSGDQLTDRLIALHSGVGTWEMHTTQIDDSTLEKVGKAMNDLTDIPIYIDDSATLTITQLRAKAKREKYLHGISLIVVDYLQLMDSGSSRGGNRVQEMADISRGLKAVARELKVPIIALSQLNRSVEMRTDKRPQMSDLRESGSIEQDADIVMFLYRDDYYNPATQNKGVTELLIRKHRNGPTGTAELFFDREKQRFTDVKQPVFHN